MADHERQRGRFVADWSKLAESGAKRDHIMIKGLRAGDQLVIETKNHRYTFRIVDPATSRAEMTSNHPKYPGPMGGCIQGALLSPWGSSIFSGRIALGLGTAFTSQALLPDALELRLTETRAVYVNGTRVLPCEAPDGTLS